MISLFIGLITIAVLFHFYYIQAFNYWIKRGIPFYIESNVYWEAFRLFKKNIMIDLIDQYNAFPNKSVYGIFFFRQPALLVKDPNILRTICIKEFEHFANHQDGLSNDEILSKNLLALKDQKWRDMRTILSPVFTGSKLRGLCDLMLECGNQTIAYYMKLIKQQNNEIPLKVDIYDACTRFTNDVIASTAFGIKVNSMMDRNNEFFNIGQKVSTFSTWRILLIFLPDVIRKFFGIQVFSSDVYKFFQNIGNETIRVRLEQKIIRPDIIHLLLEARKEQMKSIEADNGNNSNQNNVLSNDDIIAQGVIFFVAGFNNVALTLSFACYELAVNSEIQEKLYDEIKESDNLNNGKINYDIIKQMKYLDMVISETLRKWNATVTTDRSCNKAFTIETSNDGQINIEPGMLISIPISGIHHDPKYFPNPEKFDPERFNDTNKLKIPPYAYIPFGLGPRICIANRFVLIETKILLFQILKNFEIVKTDETPIPIILQTGPTLRPINDNYGLAFKLRK